MTDHHDFSFDDDHAPPPDDHLAWDDAGHDFAHDFDSHDLDSHEDGAAFSADSPGLDAAHEDGSAFSGLDAAHLDTPHDAYADHPADDVSLAPDPHHVSDISDLPGEEMFPPAVDVGELPEPVDGLPWIDTGSLGLADISAALHDQEHVDPVRPEELAEYAGTDLPPGADPWATLAESDDPATAALAKWWQQN